MATAPSGAVFELYPGTLDARSTRSFENIFEVIRLHVEQCIVSIYGLPCEKISSLDAIDLLSGHKTYVNFELSRATFGLRDVQLPSECWIDEDTRLLLSDMATHAETAYVIDRISRRARNWPLATKFSDKYILFINPRAPKDLSFRACETSRQVHDAIDHECFMCLVSVHGQVVAGIPVTFGDVCVDVYDAAQYALLRADFEPAIPPEYPHVLRVRVGLLVRVFGISDVAAGELGGVGSRTMDIPNSLFAQLLVPGLFSNYTIHL